MIWMFKDRELEEWWQPDVEGILLLLQKTREMVYEKEGFYGLGCLG